MEIIKSKISWSKYTKKCINHYNVLNTEISNTPEEYPCIAIPQLISDINGSRIKFNFVYKKDCQKLLKSL